MFRDAVEADAPGGVARPKLPEDAPMNRAERRALARERRRRR